MSLQAKLAAFKKNFEAGGPPYSAPGWIHEPMRRATNELIETGAANNAKKVDDVAPTFNLRDADGNEVSSTEILTKGPLVISFYRGVWCPYCNMELQALQEAQPTIRELGANLVAISPQTTPNSRRSARENKLEFPILSDPGNEVAAAFGLRFSLPDYLVDLYKNVFKNDLGIVNGDQTWTLPMPARYVIGQDGSIVYAEVNPDYTTRPDPEELLPALRKLADVTK
ncbi:AhpC/TSA family protein [Paraburkholderia sp. Tr-20389]|uniref:peroxiredoxin-like family protein n=1 Tax=Paraburkholderia sp. Tr-20389 TaxID=2703903 RepID=UPI0019803ABE|nr:peroxiredoxin-like family protein [Paraburkholderia sp. Tr-20389]MBN3757525.1 AhpC/TSA family protein [Paraburkholderia sp. Tr-20389]